MTGETIIEDTSVCGTIINQLGGGRRLQVMCGTKRITTDEDQKRITFGIARKGANLVRVTLTPDDLYRVELIRQCGLREYAQTGVLMKVTKQEDGIYAEDLRASFTRVTGFHLSL